MDQQNNPTPNHVPTEAEIARLEAEAVAALQRGEPIPRRDPLPEGTREEIPAEAVRTDFVPYVDDVPDPEPAPKPAPGPDAGTGESVEDEDDDEYIPSEMEKRINAMTPEQWKRWQTLGGAGVGLLAVAVLFVFGQELSTYGLLLAVLLALPLPRYLERSWRVSLSVARRAMIVAMLVGLVIMFLITGFRTNFNFKAQ